VTLRHIPEEGIPQLIQYVSLRVLPRCSYSDSKGNSDVNFRNEITVFFERDDLQLLPLFHVERVALNNTSLLEFPTAFLHFTIFFQLYALRRTYQRHRQ